MLIHACEGSVHQRRQVHTSGVQHPLHAATPPSALRCNAVLLCWRVCSGAKHLLMGLGLERLKYLVQIAVGIGKSERMPVVDSIGISVFCYIRMLFLSLSYGTM